MKYEAIRKNEKQFTALTGLSVEEFGRLTETFAPKCDQVSEESTFDGKIRTCRYSSQGGRAYNHTRKVVFTPKYCKNHFTQEAQAAVFGIKGDLGNNSIKLLHPILLRALKDLAPKKCVQDIIPRNKTHFLRAPTPNSTPDGRPTRIFWRQKKRQTLNNLILASNATLVLWVGATACGRMHNKTLADAANIPIHEHIKADLGFYGMQHMHLHIEIKNSEVPN